MRHAGSSFGDDAETGATFLGAGRQGRIFGSGVSSRALRIAPRRRGFGKPTAWLRPMAQAPGAGNDRTAWSPVRSKRRVLADPPPRRSGSQAR